MKSIFYVLMLHYARHLTSLQKAVLHRAGRKDVLPGTALMFEQQMGRIRQVNTLLKMYLVYEKGGRIVANDNGRRVLAFIEAGR